MYEKMEVFLDNFFSILGQFCQIRVNFLRTFRMIIRRSIVFCLLHVLLVQGGFAQFFGFDPATGKVVDEEKVSGKKKNPLDTTDLFERFMGFK